MNEIEKLKNKFPSMPTQYDVIMMDFEEFDDWLFNNCIDKIRIREVIESIPQWRCDSRIHEPEGCPKCIAFKKLGIE